MKLQSTASSIFALATFLLFAAVMPTVAISKIPDQLPPIRVLFDSTHGQSFGNADWKISAAYSDFAEDLTKYLNATLNSSSTCFKTEKFTLHDLKDIDVLVIPEPNDRFTQEEIHVIHTFIENGGGLFAIADHGGSDRNFSGWDSSLIFNEILGKYGITFAANTFSEAPIRGYLNNQHPVMHGISRLGAWAATTIFFQKSPFKITSLVRPRSETGSFLLSAEISKGRLIAMGDSSPFDDGTGSDDKNRHSSYQSWLFDYPRLAVQATAWLASIPAPEVPAIPPPFPQISKSQTLDPQNLVIDAAHGNTDAGIMDRFGHDIQIHFPLHTYLSSVSLNSLDRISIFVIANPTLPFSPHELNQLKSWIQNGGKLLIAGYNARNPLSGIPNINTILRMAGSRMRMNADEILDPVHNTGRPWSNLITNFVDRLELKGIDSAVFWAASSLVTPNGLPLTDSSSIQILARTQNTASSNVQPHYTVKNGFIIPSNIPLPVAAQEKIGKGCIILLSAVTLNNHQYPTEQDRVTMDREKWDHRTKEFNRAVIRILNNF